MIDAAADDDGDGGDDAMRYEHRQRTYKQNKDSYIHPV